MTSIFISYRRRETAQVALTVSQYLARKLGSDKVFLDVEGLGAGSDYPDVLTKAIENSDVLIAIIGPMWIETLHRAQEDASDSRIDWVALEIGKGFDAGLKIVPVLVDGATMPTKDQLPQKIMALADRHAFVLSRPEAFKYEMGALATELGATENRRPGLVTAALICIGVILAIIFWRQSSPTAVTNAQEQDKATNHRVVCRATATSAGATGVGQADTLVVAEQTALRFCRNSGGEDCRVVHSSCASR